MSLCRIIEQIPGIRYRAKSTAGVWRTLGNEGSIENGETIEVFSNGPRFGVVVCSLQNRVSGAWAKQVSIDLDLAQGTSHTRKDLIAVSGDATDSTVSITLTTGKGHRALKNAHLAQLRAEETRGGTFTWNGNILVGVVSEISNERHPHSGGYLEGADARLVANRKQFVELGSMPVVGNPLLVGSEKLFIAQVGVTDTVYTFELRRDNNV